MTNFGNIALKKISVLLCVSNFALQIIPSISRNGKQGGFNFPKNFLKQGMGVVLGVQNKVILGRKNLRNSKMALSLFS